MYKKMVAAKDDYEQTQKLLEQKSKRHNTLLCTNAIDYCVLCILVVFAHEEIEVDTLSSA